MKLLMKTLALTGVAAAVLHKINDQLEQNTKEWNPTHFNELFFYPWKEGHIAYHVRGSGKPVIFIHGLGTGSSTFEWRKNLDQFADHYKVYSLDMLGYGLSDKPRIRYTPETYLTMLEDFIENVVGGPVHIVASSLSAAYAIKLAHKRPKLVRHMILICPTGISEDDSKEVFYSRMARKMTLQVPILNTSMYYLIASKTNIRSFLQDYVYSQQENLTEDIVDNYYLAAHLGGKDAGWAPISFLRGSLDLDIHTEWTEIEHQTLIVWGQEATLLPVSHAGVFKKYNSHCSVEIFQDSGLLPHDEEALAFNSTCQDFLQNGIKRHLYLQ
jgi:pimeloyl-ACP methyl ester carboxylesterase